MVAALLALMIAADPADAPKGKLVPVGGGSTQPVRAHILKLAGGSDARVLVLPQASSSADGGKELAQMWRDLGAKSATSLDLADPAAAVKAVEAADLIWMGGGDQNRLMKALPSEVIAAIKNRYRAGAVVGGTSAGAAVISGVMLTGDADLERVRRGATKTAEGLGLWTDVIVDQHFVKRDRFNRLLSAVLDRPTLVGVGIDEGTGVIVSGKSFEVIGVGQVTVIDGRKSSVGPSKPGEPHTAVNVAVHVLRPGMTWELK
ncbi:MAG: cyanophycinase [Gemmataceae bacterium]